MQLSILAYSYDYGRLRRLLVEDQGTQMVTVLSMYDNWEPPPLLSSRWNSYAFAHAAVQRAEFDWVIDPQLNDQGYVTNAVTINQTELKGDIGVIEEAHEKGLLPAVSAEDLNCYLTKGAPATCEKRMEETTADSLTSILASSELALSDFERNEQVLPYFRQILDAGRTAAKSNRVRETLEKPSETEPPSNPIDLGKLLKNIKPQLSKIVGTKTDVKLQLGQRVSPVLFDDSCAELLIFSVAQCYTHRLHSFSSFVVGTREVEFQKNRHHEANVLRSGSYVVLSVGRRPRNAFTALHRSLSSSAETDLMELAAWPWEKLDSMVARWDGHSRRGSEAEPPWDVEFFFPKAETTETVKQGMPVLPLEKDYPRGFETVLVIEDNESVRHLTTQLLRGLGYSVLQANSPEMVRDVVDLYGGSIDLLLSDIVLPKMSGPKIVERVHDRLKGARVLFMSAYSDEIIKQHGWDYRMPLLQKPFDIMTLAQSTRQALDEKTEDTSVFRPSS
jgi:CheY-like chemotaxis protein